MATPIINAFSQFQLTEAEDIAGRTLSINQLMFIQNLLAEQALKKVSMVYDPNNHQVFLQQEAENHGWMSCLNYIIECHQAAISALNTSNSVDNPQSDSDG